VLFLLVILLVLVGTAAAVGYYARGSYFVAVDNGEVAIFKGRPGGLLWFEPTIEERTNFPEADIPPTRLDDVREGKSQSSMEAARRYIANLLAEHEQITGLTTTTTTTTTLTGTPADATTSTTAATVVP
jgi:protein phosphatase